MILADIGNTHVRYAVIGEGGIALLETVPATAFKLPDAARPDTRYAVASVVPELNGLFPRERTVFLTWNNSGLTFAEGVDPVTVGADRLANAVALKRMFGGSALCIDAGSCITLEVVDRSGAFAGGAILPGRSLCRYAVSRRAAQLYDTPFSENVPDAAGKNTAEAMMFGIDRGLVGAARELVDVLVRQHDIPSDHCCITGGDAPFFASALQVPLHPNLTFRGLAAVHGLLD